MKEVVKVFGYILVLMVCFGLMQALSTFEFGLRDKSQVTYESVWDENFEKELDSNIWTTSDKGVGLTKGRLEISLADTEGSALAICHKTFEKDTGYVEVQLFLPESEDISTELSLMLNDGTRMTAYDSTPDSNAKVKTLRTDEVPLSEVDQFSISISSSGSATELLDDQPRRVLIQRLSYMKKVWPEKLF